MFQNYLKSALRNLLNNRLNSFINILGLAVGFAVAILITLYIQHEKSYEKWIAEGDQVYRVYRFWKDGGETVWTPGPLAQTLKEELPEVEQATGVSTSTDVLLQFGQEKIYLDRVGVVDSSFFEVVALPLAAGQGKDVLKPSDGLVISERLARVFFGEEDPIGKVIRINAEDDYTVSGVLAPLGGNTHLDYEAYIRFSRSSTRWTNNNRATYVKLAVGAEVASLESKITALVTPFLEQANRGDGRSIDEANFPDWRLHHLYDIHLNPSATAWFDSNKGNIKYLYIFGMIGLIMLMVACINYINLTTATAAQRALEIGVRKVSGAARSQLVMQFMTEALLQTSIAFFAALVLAELFLPLFNGITDRELQFLQAGLNLRIFEMGGLALLIGLLAGIAPAILISAFKPSLILKRGIERGSKGNLFRRALVMIQFGVSVVLIIVMLIVFRQVNFMMSEDLGFSSDQVVVVPMNLSRSYLKVEALKEAFLDIEGVQSVTTSSSVPGQPLPDWGVIIDGKEPSDTYMSWVDPDYAETLNLTVSEGRFFSKEIASDTLNAFVVNETFIRENGLESPFEAQLRFTYSDANESYRIVGVVKDFHFWGLDRSIGPMIMMYQPNRQITSIKMATQNIEGTIKAIEKLWASVEPEHPFRYSFLDEDFATQYAEQERFGQTMLYATLLTIFIGVLGLFGLATHSTIRRTKEIGIRKVVGATVNNIVLMLVKDFTRWVLFAALLAMPLGYWLMSKWMEDFAFQAAITPLPFIIAVASVLLVAILTVSYQALRTALANPVESLRQE
ncbi:MAG: ABC transporter permease [Saprospiraceae bacterium]